MAPTPQQPLRVHLTGFGPFRNYKENPSWLAVQPLNGITLTTRRRPIILTSSLIPVTYDAALSLIPPLHDQDLPYDLIVHVGVGAGALGGQPGRVVLERRARRFGYAKEDAEGHLAQKDEEGRQGFVGPEWDVGAELQTGVHRAEVVSWAKSRGLEHVGLSDDAGLYLCEFVYFASLASARRKFASSGKPLVPVQFIHVPPLHEPYDVAHLSAAVKLLVWGIVHEGGPED